MSRAGKAEGTMFPHKHTLISPNYAWRRQWQPTPVLLPGKSHGRRSLVGCSPRGREESDTTEQLHFHFYALEKEMATHLCSCLENPRDGGAWWAAVHGVTQSQTRLKWLSSSSSSSMSESSLFSSKNIMVSGLIFQLIIHFEFIFYVLWGNVLNSLFYM